MHVKDDDGIVVATGAMPFDSAGVEWLAMSEAAGSGRVEWWRRRESNPRPKGLSPRNSTCVAVLDISWPATKNGECAGHQSG